MFKDIFQLHVEQLELEIDRNVEKLDSLLEQDEFEYNNVIPIKNEIKAVATEDTREANLDLIRKISNTLPTINDTKRYYKLRNLMWKLQRETLK